MITQAGPIRWVSVALLGVVCLLTACGSQSPRGAAERWGPPADRDVSLGQRAASVALQQLGVPYRYGGSTTRGFDCSGLVQFAWAAAGKALPRTTGQLWEATETVATNELRPGDLVFFRIDGKMSHVGLYVGSGEFVHAPSTGRSVTTERLDSPFYRQALLRAARPD